MKLLWDEGIHFFVGLVLGSGLVLLGLPTRILAWVLVSSIVIDVDHIVDYLLTVGFRWNTSALMTGSYFRESGRVIVFLHSWELAVVLVVIGSTFADKRVAIPLLGLGVGMLGHLAVDQATYQQPWATYFLLARVMHGFADPQSW